MADWKPPEDAEVTEETPGGWTPPSDAVVADEKKNGSPKPAPVSKTGGIAEGFKAIGQSYGFRSEDGISKSGPGGLETVFQQQKDHIREAKRQQLTSGELRGALDQLKAPAYIKPQPLPENTQEENYNIEAFNLHDDAATLAHDQEILAARGDMEGAQILEAQKPLINERAKELVRKYPEAIQKIKDQERIDEDYSGVGGTLLETGAKFGNVLTEGVKNIVAFAPRTAANLTGVEGGISETTANAIEKFFDSPAMKWGESSQKFQNADGTLNWNKFVPAIGETAGTMLALLGSAELMGGGNAGLFASSYAQTRNDYYDLARQKGLSVKDANYFADASAGLTSMLELVSPNTSVLAKVNKTKLADDYVKLLAKDRSAATNLLTKEIIPENIQEISQMIGDKAVEAGADYLTGQNRFDPNFFDPNEYLSTIALTTVTTGLITGKGAINETKTNRNNAIRELSANPELTQQILAQQVETGQITPEQAESVAQQVVRHAEAAAKVPDAIPDDKKADVTELVAEKQDIETAIKDKDPALTLREQARVDEINNELTGIASPELLEAEEGKPKTTDTNGKVNEKGVEDGREEKTLLTPEEDTGVEQSAPVVEESQKNTGQKPVWMTPATKDSPDFKEHVYQIQEAAVKGDLKRAVERGEITVPEYIKIVESASTDWLSEKRVERFKKEYEEYLKSVEESSPFGTRSMQLDDLRKILPEDEATAEWQDSKSKLGYDEIQVLSQFKERNPGRIVNVKMGDYTGVEESGNTAHIVIDKNIYSPDGFTKAKDSLMSNIEDSTSKSFFDNIKSRLIDRISTPSDLETFLILQNVRKLATRIGNNKDVHPDAEVSYALNGLKKIQDSKVFLDHNFEPMIFMHGGPEGITKFREPGDPNHKQNDPLTGQEGIYFSRDLGQADKYSGKGKPKPGRDIYYVYLKSSKPYHMDSEFDQSRYPLKSSETISTKDRQELEKLGYDSVVWDKEGSPKHEVVVFNPDQIIQIATYNKGKVNNEQTETEAPPQGGETPAGDEGIRLEAEVPGTDTERTGELTPEEKSNLQSIEAATGDNFRVVQNVYNKYAGENKKPLDQITVEDYQKAKEAQAEAKAEETPDPGKKVRQMAKKFRDAGFKVPKSLAEYTPVTTQEFLDQADKIVEELGVEGATAFLLNNNYVIDDRLRPALGGKIMTELNNLSEEATDQESIDLFADLKFQVMNNILPASTKAGQALKMFSLFYKGSPYTHVKEVQAAIDKINQSKVKAVQNLVENLNKENKTAVEEVVNKLFGNRVISDKVKKAKDRYESSKSELKTLFKNYQKTGISTNPYERAKQDLKFDKALAKTAKDFIVYQSVKFEEFIKEIASNLGISVDDIDKKHLKEIFDRVKSKEIGKEIKSSLKDMEVKLKDLVKDHYSEIQKTQETLAEKIKDEFGLESRDAEEVAKAVREEFQKITAKEKLRVAKASGITLWKEIVDLSDQGLLQSEEVVDQLAKKLGIVKLTPQIQEQLVKLAKEIDSIPENATSDKARAIQNLVDYKYKLSKDLGISDYVISNFLTNIFGSVGANLINFATNIVESLNLAGRSMYRAVIDGDFGDIKIMLEALAKGHKTGLSTTAEILRTGVNPRRDIGNITPRNVYELIGTGDESRMGAVEKFVSKAARGEIAGKMGEVITKGLLAERKFWSRMLGAMDGLSGTANMEIASVMVAQKEADARGLSGKERSKFIRDSVFGDAQTVANAKQEALDAGLKEGSRKFNERVLDYVIKNRPEWLYERAKEIAQKATLSNAPPENTITGWVANRLTAQSGKNPAMKFIFPAVNSLANLYVKLYERTPLEFASIAYDKVKDRFRDEKVSPEEYQRRLESASVALVASVALFMLAGGFDDDEQCFDITGSGTGDPQLDAQKRNTGWKPHSIRFTCGGGYYDYSYWPTNFMIGMVGDMRDWAKYSEDAIDKLKGKISEKLFEKPYDALTEEERSQVYAEMSTGKYNLSEIKDKAWWDALTKALMSPVKTFMDFGVMTGLNDIIGILGDKGASVANRVKKFTSNVASGLTFPGYFKEIKSATDPNIYENKTWLEMYLSKQPFVQVGDVKLDAFGRDITQYVDKHWYSGAKYVLTRRFYSEPKGTPLDAFLNNNHVKVSPPQNRDFMADEDFDRFVRRQGAIAESELNNMLKSGDFDGLSPDEIQDKVGDWIADIRKAEKGIVVMEQENGREFTESELKNMRPW